MPRPAQGALDFWVVNVDAHLKIAAVPVGYLSVPSTKSFMRFR